MSRHRPQDADKIVGRADFEKHFCGHAGGTFPEGINSHGEIVGNYIGPTTGQQGFLWTRDGAFITLTFPGATSTDAKAINSKGTITGNYTRANGKPHGFVLLPGCDRCDP